MLHRARLRFEGNIGGAYTIPGLWVRWASLMDGAMEEAWTDGGTGAAAWLYWFKQELAEATWSEAHHKQLMLHSYSGTEAGNRFGLATMLLAANGESTYSLSNTSYGDAMPAWYPEYATAERLGAPRGRYTRLPSGVYRRRFAHGLVLVNPSLKVNHVSLSGTYSGSGLAHVSAATLGPTSGLILLRG